jgi:hypothetical protein
MRSVEKVMYEAWLTSAKSAPAQGLCDDLKMLTTRLFSMQITYI